MIKNLGDFLPRPDTGTRIRTMIVICLFICLFITLHSNTEALLVASSVFSSQILTSSGVVNSFGDNRRRIQFLTNGVSMTAHLS